MPADDVTIVADLEAGIGTLTRLEKGAVDVTLIVVEPTPRSINVAQRAAVVAVEHDQGDVIIIANKVDNDEDVDRISANFNGYTIVPVPADETVDRADREGLSPIDVDPTAPAVLALESLASTIGG